jgi:hypothetical protein
MMEALERAWELVKATPGMSAKTAIRVASGLEPEPTPLARAGKDDVAATPTRPVSEEGPLLADEVVVSQRYTRTNAHHDAIVLIQHRGITARIVRVNRKLWQVVVNRENEAAARAGVGFKR